MPPVPPPRKSVELEATGLDEAGAGTGLSGDRTLHVPDLLPGERAEVAIEHASPHRPESWGHIARRLGATSPDRTTPACPAYGRCGGCTWQALAYPAQLVHKRARVVAALPPGTAVAPVTPSPATLGYRHKGKYVAGTVGGRLVLGAWAPRRHELVDTAGCRVVAPLIDELRGRVVAACAAAALAPWDERRKTGHLRYVIIRATRAGRALVILVVRSSTPAAALEPIARHVAGDPRVAGVVRVDNDRDDGGLLTAHGATLAGAATVDDTLAGVPVALGAQEFAQVNPAQADAMYARVAELAAITPGERAADLYAGLGGISFALAAAGAAVTAIERDPSSVAALTAARPDIRAIAGDAAQLAALTDLAVVVVNPPRKGLAPEVIDAIAASTATRLVYVSCGPESLGRDVRMLGEHGWRVEAVEPFDLMPGTGQVETIVKLAR